MPLGTLHRRLKPEYRASQQVKSIPAMLSEPLDLYRKDKQYQTRISQIQETTWLPYQV